VYTRCPDCATVFRVTADALRIAQGDVRCGVCSNTFNAVENLSEQAFRPDIEVDDDAPSPDDSMTVEELPGTENIELAVEPAAPVDDEDTAMEFHGDAEAVEKLFVVEESKPPPNFDPAKVAASLTLGENDAERTDEYPILVLDEQDAPEEIILESEPEEPAPVPTPSPTAPRILIPEEMRQRLAQEAASRTALASDFDDADGPREPRRWPWAAGIAAALLLFGAQVVHSQREKLVREPGVGPWIARAYALFGAPLATPTDLAAYELRQWGAANDPLQPERLMLRASIVNRAPYAQPMPLLRLALQDRFGSTLGVRDIAATDYLPGEGTPRLLESGQRADAEIRIVDPGKDAVGFEMDVCLPMDGSIRCASQVAAAAP
jgi:predicted Zn finger-like uncharacterized protein